MAVRGNIRIDGMEDLLKRLKTLEPKLAKKVIRQSLRAGAKVILTAARAKAPRRSGLLKKSIKVRALKRSRTGRIGITVQTGEGDFQGKTFYGAFVEYGHKLGARQRKPPSDGEQLRKAIESGGSDRRFIEAKPFMEPAFDQNKDKAAAVIKQMILEGIEREATSK
jgi:HK97 gp10 family phage protein